LNYRETFSADDIGKILGDRQTAEYLDGVFSVIRSIIGYSTIVSDILFSEIVKDDPDKNVMVEVLNESYGKMTDLLGDITNAHQIVYETHISDLSENVPISFSDAISETAALAQELLEGAFEINAETENDIFTAASAADAEILMTDLLYHVISYEIPPSKIEIKLERNENGERAVLTVRGAAGNAVNTVPAETESSKLMKTEEVARIFERKFCENVNGLIFEKETDTGLVITVELDIISEQRAAEYAGVRSKIDFNAANKRFSPVTLILSKFNPKKTYVLPPKKTENLINKRKYCEKS
jgi:hypothetical protein